MKNQMEELQVVVNKYNKNDFSDLENFSKNEFVLEFFQILEHHKIIRVNNRGKIKKNYQSKIVVGPMQVKNKFGFILGDEDYYVYNAQGYLNGDVVIGMEDLERKGSKSEAKVIDVLLRDKNLLVCRVNKRMKISLMGENPHNYKILLTDKAEQNLFNERQIVHFKVDDIVNDTIFVSFVKVISDENDPDIQMKIVLANHGIETEFSNETMEEIENIDEITPADIANRVDLRNEIVMTIDGADSKDLDDAIHMIKEKDGYRVTVSIADVSSYVKAGSPLDIDASDRATSVYFVDRVVPMLPKKLSNGICSLHPGVDRLTISCEMLIDEKGHVIERKIFPSVINSKYRLTYEGVNKMLMDNDAQEIAKYPEIYGILRTMNQLRKILNKKRINRGSFNLEDKDAKFKIDEMGNITDIVPFVRGDAEKLIEEFMIVANETVAETIFWMDLPFIYRVHDKPNPKKLRDVLDMFMVLGIQVKGDLNDFHPQIFKQALDQIEDQTNKRIVSDLIVRSLTKAKYLELNHEHFGLASKCYTHFTSPIRRYPDLIVHRLLRKYLFDSNIQYTESDIENIRYKAAHASEKEVSAIKAEQVIEDMKKAEYMVKFINQEFEGSIASVAEFGFFVELENTTRGLIRFNSIKEFTKAINYKILFTDGTSLSIGDKIKVKLASVDKQKGLLEFEPVEYTTIKRSSYGRNNKQKGKPRVQRGKKTRSGNSPKGKRNKVATKKRR